MTALKKSSLRLVLQGLATIAVCATVANAQEKRPCGSMEYVGVIADNPFTAERVTTEFVIGRDTMDKPNPLRQLLARDESGQIRIERRMVLAPSENKMRTLTNGEGESFQVSDEEMNTHIIIHNCGAGRDIQIEPGTRIVLIKDQWKPAKVTPTSTNTRTFSLGLPLPGKASPELVVEDLGYREMQGIQARGERRTTIGTEKDGERNGKPIRQWEQWVSDDLDAVIGVTQKDFKTGKGSYWVLTHIKRDRPDSRLFEIPPGYKVNPKPDEFPAMFPRRNE